MPTPPFLQPGDSIVLDIGAPFGHYWCDMTRTIFYRSVSEEQRKVYETVRRANEAAIAIIKPGVAFKEFDLAARKVIEDAGYGEYFTHRTGHSIGMKEHERPPVSSESETIARPGMVFSIEPGIYLPETLAFALRTWCWSPRTAARCSTATPKT